MKHDPGSKQYQQLLGAAAVLFAWTASCRQHACAEILRIAAYLHVLFQTDMLLALRA